MLATKSVKQGIQPTDRVLGLLESFRRMVNDCIEIGLKWSISSLKRLSLQAYRELAYEVPSYYKLCAISKAAGILKNYRRAKRKNRSAKKPHVSKPMLTTCYGFKIENGVFKLPLKRGERIEIPLNRHTQAVISGHKVRSITLTPDSLSICYSKEVAFTTPKGFIGVDRNLENATTASNDGVKRYDLSGCVRIKSTYRRIKSHFRRNDVRIRQRLFEKYGIRERNRIVQRLHKVSKAIVREAKERGYGIALERLKGIRKLYQKGNGQGRDYRAKMNSWSFHELQRQIEYKARWEGIEVVYVPAGKTTSTCARCGSRIIECAGRLVWCQGCRVLVDRDVNAALNVAARALRFEADGRAVEAMVAEPPKSNPQSRCPQVA